MNRISLGKVSHSIQMIIILSMITSFYMIHSGEKSKYVEEAEERIHTDIGYDILPDNLHGSRYEKIQLEQCEEWGKFMDIPALMSTHSKIISNEEMKKDTFFAGLQNPYSTEREIEIESLQKH